MEEELTTTTAVTTEDSILTKAVNGVTKLISNEAPTSSEHFWGTVVVATAASIASSKAARKRMSEGKEAVFGIFL